MGGNSCTGLGTRSASPDVRLRDVGCPGPNVKHQTSDITNHDRQPRVGVDIGGTFTDLVLLDSTGEVHTHKVLSTPPDYGSAIKQGLDSLLRQVGYDASELADFVHATTIVTNAVIEKKGAPTALITTKGF